MSNLIINAVRYAQQGTAVTEQAKRASTSVQRSKATVRTLVTCCKCQHQAVAGFGMGQCLVAEILARYNSKISVEGIKGIGPKFYFVLSYAKHGSEISAGDSQ